MMREGKFSNANHRMAIREERSDGYKSSYDVKYDKLKEIVAELYGTDRRFILRAKNTGDWLNVWGTTVNGIVLAATEFCDFICTL